MDPNYEVCCGIDVGKWSHHFYALHRESGEVLMDGKVSQDEGDLRRALCALKERGSLAIVVDQPGSMSSLLFAVARSVGAAIGFITPMAMARAIDMYGGDLKSDAHDAMIIAEVASGLPKLVKPACEKDALMIELYTLMSHDRRLTEDATRTTNRLHDLLLSSCPALELQMRGKRIQTGVCLMVLERYGGSLGLRKAGRANVRRWAKSKKGIGDAAARRVDELYSAAVAQTVGIPGQESMESLVKSEAGRLLSALRERKAVAERRSSLLAGMPEARILMTMPGVGEIVCATFLSEVGSIDRFRSAAKLASYAGLAPKVRQSGTSVHSVSKPRGGNRRLKRVLVLSASKSIQFSEESRAYYDRKRAEGRSYNSAVTALARKRLDVMYAMLKNGTAYEKKNG